MDHLIEPGIRSYFTGSFKECKKFKLAYYTRIVNVVLFLFFILFFGSFLYYKKKTRLTVDEKHKKSEADRNYVIQKVRALQIQKCQTASWFEDP